MSHPSGPDVGETPVTRGSAEENFMPGDTVCVPFWGTRRPGAGVAQLCCGSGEGGHPALRTEAGARAAGGSSGATGTISHCEGLCAPALLQTEGNFHSGIILCGLIVQTTACRNLIHFFKAQIQIIPIITF